MEVIKTPDISYAVAFMIETAKDNSHGYDQTHRNGPDYDCSSLVSTALWNAGFNISPYSWTGNMKSQLIACGFKECSYPWKAGDVHLNETHHVCMSINSTQIAQASINEKGTARGGEPGDQTGKEINIRDYYDYPWDCHLRYEPEPGKKTIDEIAHEVICGHWDNGDTRKRLLTEAGYDYEAVQKRVNQIMDTDYNINLRLAREVIQGKWGDGLDRVKRLTESGYDYEDVQDLVNEILGHPQGVPEEVK